MIPILFGSCYLSSHFSLSVKISTEHSSGQPLHSSHISTKGPLLEALTPMIEYFCQYFINIVFFIVAATYHLLDAAKICTYIFSFHPPISAVMDLWLLSSSSSKWKPWSLPWCTLTRVTKQGAASGWLHSRARSFSLMLSLPLGLCLAIPYQIDLWLWFFWDIF